MTANCPASNPLLLAEEDSQRHTDYQRQLNGDRLRGRADAATYLRDRYGIRCSRQTLAKYACVGGGPSYRLIGRTPVYPETGLDAWALARLSKPYRSTSEYRNQAAA